MSTVYRANFIGVEQVANARVQRKAQEIAVKLAGILNRTLGKLPSFRNEGFTGPSLAIVDKGVWKAAFSVKLGAVPDLEPANRFEILIAEVTRAIKESGELDDLFRSHLLAELHFGIDEGKLAE